MILEGFRCDVSEKRVVVHRHTNRIRAVRPLSLEVSWDASGGGGVTSKRNLYSSAPAVFEVRDWIEGLGETDAIVSTEQLLLFINGTRVHDFGPARNHHLIHQCLIEYQAEPAPSVSLSLQGEDQNGAPLINWRRVKQIDNMSPHRIKREILDLLPPLRKINLKSASTEQLTVPLGTSSCKRFFDECILTVDYDGDRAPWINYSRSSHFVKNIQSLNIENDNLLVRYENGKPSQVRIRHHLKSVADLAPSVKKLQLDMNAYALPVHVGLEGEYVIDITFDKEPPTGHRMVLRKSETLQHNNLAYQEIEVDVEVARPVVVEITKLCFTVGDENHHNLKISAILKNKFTGETGQGSTQLENLHRFDQHWKRLQFLTNSDTNDDALAYYQSITPKEFHLLDLDLAPMISKRFDLDISEAMYKICPFTLTVFKSGHEVGRLPAEFARRENLNWTHVNRIDARRWGERWKKEIQSLGFRPRKYCNSLKVLVEWKDFYGQNEDNSNKKLTIGTQGLITDEMWQELYERMESKFKKNGGA